MPLDETLVEDAAQDFRQEGERAATRLAISFLMAREARYDSMFLTKVCERFDKEIAELGFSHDHESMDRLLVMARRYFQLMVLTAECMAQVECQQALRAPAAPDNLTSCAYPPPVPPFEPIDSSATSLPAKPQPC